LWPSGLKPREHHGDHLVGRLEEISVQAFRIAVAGLIASIAYRTDWNTGATVATMTYEGTVLLLLIAAGTSSRSRARVGNSARRLQSYRATNLRSDRRRQAPRVASQ
jgi:hypothetical protein